mmetsp:Transcript_1949/g.4195  ORF Transcript_1949/g.4195 Transcript_1949/m.4195 type:complete len:231 (+) Transcript_1949:749-1441(+)
MSSSAAEYLGSFRRSTRLPLSCNRPSSLSFTNSPLSSDSRNECFCFLISSWTSSITSPFAPQFGSDFGRTVCIFSVAVTNGGGAPSSAAFFATGFLFCLRGPRRKPFFIPPTQGAFAFADALSLRILAFSDAALSRLASSMSCSISDGPDATSDAIGFGSDANDEWGVGTKAGGPGSRRAGGPSSGSSSSSPPRTVMRGRRVGAAFVRRRSGNVSVRSLSIAIFIFTILH